MSTHRCLRESPIPPSPRSVLRAATLSFALGFALLPAPASAQGRGGLPGGGGGATQARVEIVEQFDRDGDGVLNAAERQEALALLSRQPAARPMGGGRGGSVAPASPGRALTPADVPSYAGVPLYDKSVVRTVFLDFGYAGWETEMAAFYNTDVQIPVRAVVDGVTYADVGVRFRGSSSFRMVPAGSKRPIRLKFDLVDEDQALEGYRTLNLLNAMNDPTFLRTILYSEIAAQYLPTPRVGYLRLVINGEDWGLYQNQQQFNRDFVVDNYGEAGGARWQVPGSPNGRAGMEYLGPDAAAYRTLYEIDTRDDPERWADLANLFRVLNETPLDRLVAELDPIFDIDGALRFLALEVALVNSDGYWSRASDYNIYQDPSGRFHVFPHDMNEGFGVAGGGGAGGGFGGGGTSLDPLVGLSDSTKPLRSRLLAVPELRERYLGYVREIAEVHLDWSVLGPRAEALHALIAPVVREDTRKLFTTEAFDTGLESATNSLKRFADQRRAFLLSAIPER